MSKEQGQQDQRKGTQQPTQSAHQWHPGQIRLPRSQTPPADTSATPPPGHQLSFWYLLSQFSGMQHSMHASSKHGVLDQHTQHHAGQGISPAHAPQVYQACASA